MYSTPHLQASPSAHHATVTFEDGIQPGFNKAVEAQSDAVVMGTVPSKGVILAGSSGSRLCYEGDGGDIMVMQWAPSDPRLRSNSEMSSDSNVGLALCLDSEEDNWVVYGAGLAESVPEPLSVLEPLQVGNDPFPLAIGDASAVEMTTVAECAVAVASTEVSNTYSECNHAVASSRVPSPSDVASLPPLRVLQEVGEVEVDAHVSDASENYDARAEGHRRGGEEDARAEKRIRVEVDASVPCIPSVSAEHEK